MRYMRFIPVLFLLGPLAGCGTAIDLSSSSSNRPVVTVPSFHRDDETPMPSQGYRVLSPVTLPGRPPSATATYTTYKGISN